MIGRGDPSHGRSSRESAILNTTDTFKQILQAEGLFARADIHDTTKFITHKYLDPFNRVGQTFEFVFFTVPDLFIRYSSDTLADWCAGDPMFTLGLQSHKAVLDNLQYSLSKYPLSPILYNHRQSNLELPDLDGSDEETAENMWGSKMYYRRSSIQSQNNFDFTMEFLDNRYLDTYMFFRLYDAYEERKAYGLVDLSSSSTYQRYIFDKILHDQMAVYKFVTLDDMSTLIYWAKLYGVYPKNVPRSAFSDMPQDGNFKFSVSFKANYVEDMDINILNDFNLLSIKYGSFSTPIKFYDDGFVHVKFTDPPYIKDDTKNFRKTRQYRLYWR